MTHASLAHAVSDREDPLGVIRLNHVVAAYSDQAYAVAFNRDGFTASSKAQVRAKLQNLFKSIAACVVSRLIVNRFPEPSKFIEELRERRAKLDSLDESMAALFVEFYGEALGRTKASEFIAAQRPKLDEAMAVIYRVDEPLLAMVEMERLARWFSGYFLVSNTVAGAGDHLTDVLHELQDARTVYRDTKTVESLLRCSEVFMPETVFEKIEATGERLSVMLYQAKELDEWRAKLATLEKACS